MSNLILTNDMIFKLTLKNLINNLGTIKAATRQYDGDFIQGVGSRVRITNPVRYVGQTTNSITTFEDTVETETDLVIDEIAVVAPSFSQIELSRSVTDFNATYSRPIGIRLANLCSVQLMNKINLGVSSFVGSTAPMSGFNQVDDAKTRLQDMAVEWSDMYFGLTPKSMSGVRQGTLGLFTPSKNDQIIMKGSVGMYDDFELYADQTLSQRHTTGSMAGNPVVAVNVVDGATTVQLSGFTNNAPNVLTAGDIITFENSFYVNPQSKQVLSFLTQFVVQSTVSASSTGTATITLNKPIILTGPYQNVSNLPVATDTISAFGVTTNGTAVNFVKNVAFTKTGIAVSAPPRVKNPGAVYSVSQADSDCNLAMSLNIAYDIKENNNLYRFDIVSGKKIFDDYVVGVAAAA